MPVTQRYQTDVFAIITAIVAVLVLVFLIVAAIYFNGIQNWTSIPSGGEATFLFWAAIVLSVIVGGITIYAFYRIFTHRAIVCPKLPPATKLAPVPKSNIPVSNLPQQSTTKEYVQPSPVGYPTDQATSPTPVAGYPTAQPVTSSAPSSTTNALQSELLNLSTAYDD